MFGKLENKVAVVTGGGRGIGAGIARVFAAAGAKVMIATRTAEHGDETVAEISAAGGTAALIAVDIGSVEAVDQVVADRMDRTIVLGPNTRGNLYGEGTRAYWLGIPTIVYATAPTYLLAVEEVNGHLDKLDRLLLRRQTLFLTRLLSRMISLPDDGF